MDLTSQVLEQCLKSARLVLALVKMWNAYNMDETGFRLGIDKCSRFVINTSMSSTRYWTHPGGNEWISVFECVCADGTLVPPVFIFKGKGINENLVDKGIPRDSKYSASQK